MFLVCGLLSFATRSTCVNSGGYKSCGEGNWRSHCARRVVAFAEAGVFDELANETAERKVVG
jgi:hypothetical protein